jgi:hypothetical protein
MTIELLNLYLGESDLPKSCIHLDLGSLSLRVYSDYTSLAAQMPRGSRRVETHSWTKDGLNASIKILDPKPGDWISTASLEITDAEAESKLLYAPERDGGILDLCHLLSFITGRLVVTNDLLRPNYTPQQVAPALCVDVETLAAMKQAWHRRSELLRRSPLLPAFLNYIEHIRADGLETRGFHLHAALNVVLDCLSPPQEHEISDEERKQIKNQITELLESRTELSPNQRQSLDNRMRGTIDARGNLHQQTVDLLKSLGVLHDDPSDQELRRVRFINQLRNRLVHRGQLPNLPDLSTEQSIEYCVCIIGGVLPSLISMALGRELGFNASGVGSLSQDPHDLMEFFLHGRWRGYEIETCNFDSWFRDTSQSHLW